MNLRLIFFIYFCLDFIKDMISVIRYFLKDWKKTFFLLGQDNLLFDKVLYIFFWQIIEIFFNKNLIETLDFMDVPGISQFVESISFDKRWVSCIFSPFDWKVFH